MLSSFTYLNRKKIKKQEIYHNKGLEFSLNFLKQGKTSIFLIIQFYRKTQKNTLLSYSIDFRVIIKSALDIPHSQIHLL